MFLFTNRRVNARAKGLAKLGSRPNEQGPNELRVADARRGRDGNWRLDILPDELTATYRKRLNLPPVPTTAEKKAGFKYFASYYAARRVIERVNPASAGLDGQGRNLLLFVHGYNNNLESVLNRAERLEQEFNLEVVAFSWPADGGGFRGTVNYLGDKQDAQASAPALNRALAKIHGYLTDFNLDYRAKVLAAAQKRFGEDRERRDEYITGRLEVGCPFRFSLLAHSMGNYLLKQSLKTSTTAADLLMFDNIVLAAADANNLDHEFWVDRMQVRQRTYVLINEDDAALAVSRMKPGGQQLARLGHYIRNLISRRAFYVDFTDARHVGKSHAYFEGNAVLRNPAVRAFIAAALNGRRAEEAVPYNDARNTYELRRVNGQ